MVTQHPQAYDAPAPPLRFWLTFLHLAALGTVGAVVIGLIIAAIGVGIGFLFVLGLGVFVFVGVIYALYGIAWFEFARIDALYGLGVPTLERRQASGSGVGAYVRMLGRQAIDGRMWRAVANFTVATVLGGFVVVALREIGWWLVTGAARFVHSDSVITRWGAHVPSRWIFVAALLGIAAAVGLIILAVFLHRTISRAIIARPDRVAELQAQVQATSTQREGAVRAANVERTRIERDLHDGVQPRLVSIAMTLGMAQQKVDSDLAAVKELLNEAHTSTKSAITELRQLARGIHASVLDDRGLDAALSALAGRSPVPVSLDVRMQPRGEGAVTQQRRDAEAAVYFAIAESLTNAAKHSRAALSRVSVRERPDGTLWARIEDDGVGGAHVQPGGGLDGIINRVTAAGGTARLDSPVGGPTSLEVTVPCAF
ncbi:histidine kinase [Microbacterium sp. YY-01]|uniref:sensor histidine kinase n=1 Tax=Microbacterium sp. YY-01 TaxID=3421634 RepID=UPI003D187217